MKHLTRWLIASLITSTVHGNLPEDSAEYIKWEHESLAAIKVQLINPPEISIPKLAS
jgi:hypothetical protein